MLNKSFRVIYFNFNIFSTKTANRLVLKFAFLGFWKCVPGRSISYYSYIVVKEEVTTTGGSNSSRKNRPWPFKNNAPFIGCISKINNTLIDNAKDLDVVMPMYNLIEYSKNYRKTTGILWNYYRDELSNDTNNNNNPNKNVINSESFKYKASITGSTYNVDAKITNAEGNKVNNPSYMQTNLVKKKLKLLFH